jgi:hypothetical protein
MAEPLNNKADSTVALLRNKSMADLPVAAISNAADLLRSPRRTRPLAAAQVAAAIQAPQ